MIRRADIEGSNGNVAVNAWLPQASYPCGNFSDTSSLKFLKTKGSIGHGFPVCIHTENQNRRSFSPFSPHEISVFVELLLGHLCYRLTDVPPQPNSPPDCVFPVGHRHSARPAGLTQETSSEERFLHKEISKLTSRVVVFHRRLSPPTYSTPLK